MKSLMYVASFCFSAGIAVSTAIHAAFFWQPGAAIGAAWFAVCWTGIALAVLWVAGKERLIEIKSRIAELEKLQAAARLSASETPAASALESLKSFNHRTSSNAQANLPATRAQQEER